VAAYPRGPVGAVYDRAGFGELVGKAVFPCSQRRGGRSKPRCVASDHPACAASVTSRHFLTGAATPPHGGGDYSPDSRTSQFTQTFYDRARTERGN